jgi:hypothetical protein
MEQSVISVFVGLGLSAATGFRVFVPMLVINLAARAGFLELAPKFGWMASSEALLAFGVATALEIAAYYVPWLDNLLDTVAMPAAVVAGTVATASVVSGMDPILRLTLAIIAGGGLASAVQLTTTSGRQISSLTSGGLANPVVSTLELAGSLGLSLLSILAPLLTGLLLLSALILAIRRRRRRRRSAA